MVTTALDTTTVLHPTGAFSLEEVASMGFGPKERGGFDGTMRLAFALDSGAGHGAAAVRQDAHGDVHCEVVAGPPDQVTAQVARILSLDHDGRPFDEIGRRDPVIARLQQAAPGLRPPLFHSPYEAAAWSIISARRSARQMAPVRRRLSEAHGATFVVAGEEVAAFPTPRQLLAVDSFPGVDATKVDRLHAVADAALDGWLHADHLRSIGPDAAHEQLLALPGIGPFYASLVVVRACGFADVLATTELRLLAAVGRLYGLDHPATADELTAIAEDWRPFRTWACVLVRAAESRLDDEG